MADIRWKTTIYITLRQLEVFAEVLKSGSTTQVSVMLVLSQPAVSATLTDPKGQLGMQLFDHVGRQLVVNEHEHLLYPRALALLRQTAGIGQFFHENNGAIRVYASSTIGDCILPATIARYRQDFPDLPLKLSVGNSRNMINTVLDFRVGIGLIKGPYHSTETISKPWLGDELVVFAAPSSPLTKGPVTLGQLATSPWILHGRGSGMRELVDYLLLSRLPRFQMVMELGNSEAIRHTVRHGFGASCLPRRVIAEQLQARALSEVPVPLPRLVHTLWRVHRRQKHISGAITRFLRYSGQVEPGE